MWNDNVPEPGLKPIGVSSSGAKFRDYGPSHCDSGPETLIPRIGCSWGTSSPPSSEMSVHSPRVQPDMPVCCLLKKQF
jgi:hypothetical protein